MDKIILGFVGKLAAGKSTAGVYLNEKYQAEIFGFSKPLRDVLQRFYLPESRENLQNLSQALRETLGQDLLAKVLASDADNSQAMIVCVDGVRRPKDIEYLKKLENFYLVSFIADQKTRYDRLVQRKQNPGESGWSFEEFKEKEKAEAESLIDEVAKDAAFTIDNNGSLEELYAQVEDILRNVNSKS